MIRLFSFIPLAILIWGCNKTYTKVETLTISDTQRQRDICLDWYGYRIDTKKAIKGLNLEIQTESELIAYCDFFKNVADTKQVKYIFNLKTLIY